MLLGVEPTKSVTLLLGRRGKHAERVLAFVVAARHQNEIDQGHGCDIRADKWPAFNQCNKKFICETGDGKTYVPVIPTQYAPLARARCRPWTLFCRPFAEADGDDHIAFAIAREM